MNFRTEISIQKQSENLINYHSKVLLLGSCFSENIGEKLSYYKFQTQVNPFGILFHPKAIETFLKRAIENIEFTNNELIYNNEQFHCLDAHSLLSNTNDDVLLNSLNTTLNKTNQQIIKSTHIIITLGTSWVYEYLNTGKIVANCHKIPQKEFKKRILSVQEIVECLNNIKSLIQSINKKTQIIFTVSPVRHTKDGFVENQQSKAHLLTAIHQISNVDYFPSYEIMMDELRDYRFYEADMIHPNQVAVNYIWEKFVLKWLSESSYNTMKKVEVIQKGLAHKPFNPNSDQHQRFLDQLKIKKGNLIKDFPFMKF